MLNTCLELEGNTYAIHLSKPRCWQLVYKTNLKYLNVRFKFKFLSTINYLIKK